MTDETASSVPSIEELEHALFQALQTRRVGQRVQAQTSTYWVRAVLQTKLGYLAAKVAFGPQSAPTCTLVLPWESGWNFSSREYAEELAQLARLALKFKLPGEHIALHVEVVEES